MNRIIPIPGVKNFRDMGGYARRDGRRMTVGRLFRAGHFSEISDDGAQKLRALGITSVVDFRSPSETERMPAPNHPLWQPQYVSTPIGGNAAAWVRDLWDRLSDSDFPAQELREQFILAFRTIPIANAAGLRRLFDVLIEGDDGGNVVFHCNAGKDRTGIAGALIMAALGMDEDDIFKDFLLTNEAVDLEDTAALYAEKISMRAGRTIAVKDVYPLVGVEADFLKAAFTVISEDYGSLEKYLQIAMGLDTDRQARLQRRFLE